MVGTELWAWAGGFQLVDLWVAGSSQMWLDHSRGSKGYRWRKKGIKLRKKDRLRV